MTRFVYLSDTHWDSGAGGYTMQPKYDEALPQLLSALQAWMSAHGPIDFLLHGGDLIHETSADAIQQAASHLELDLPVYLGLGNHDLTTADALSSWLALAPQLFPTGSPDYTIAADDCLIHVIPNQWGAEPFLWHGALEPHFLPDQLERLEQRLLAGAGRPQLIVTHNPVLDLDPAQTGLDQPFHQPPASFTDVVTAVAQKHGVICVLGAHSHANMHRQHHGVRYVTVSAFVETPFEFKVFEIDSSSLTMQTHNLWQQSGLRADYDWNRTFAQGRACDRVLEHRLG